MLFGKVVPKDSAIVFLDSDHINNPEVFRLSLWVAKESYHKIEVDARGLVVTAEIQAILDEFGATVINAKQSMEPK